MKKFIYLLSTVLCLLLSFTSCGKDDDPSIGDSDYIEVTFNGKTYTETIPSWGYVILDNAGTDSQGRPISFTNVVIDKFEDQYGFTFMPSIAHFARKSDLMSAEPGKYPHQSDFGNILEGELVCENFTLVSDIEISLDYYEFVYGTHQVTSIREAGNNAQIEGTFQATYKCEETGRQCQVQGKYRMTLDVHI